MRLLFLAIATCVLTAPAGCESRPPPAAQGKDVVRPALRFAVDVPSGWSARDLNGDVVLELLAPGSATPAAAKVPASAPAAAEVKALEKEPPPLALASRARSVVQVLVIEREEKTLAEWADRAIKDSQELQGDLEVTHREPAKLADGREALRITLKNPRAVEPLIQEMLLVFTDANAYAVIATAPQSEQAACGPAFQKCFDTFVVW
jgi:hypothetical protein